MWKFLINSHALEIGPLQLKSCDNMFCANTYVIMGYNLENVRNIKTFKFENPGIKE